MNELDPMQAASLEDLAACLRRLHIWADKPTYRELEHRTIHKKGPLSSTNLERVPLRRSTLSDVLQGRTFPRKAFLLTFVEACGVDLDADRRWEQVWDQLAIQYGDRDSPGSPEQDHQRIHAEAMQVAQEIVAAAERQSEEILVKAQRKHAQILKQAEAAAAKAQAAVQHEAHGEAAKIVAAAEQRASEMIIRAQHKRDQILAQARATVTDTKAEAKRSSSARRGELLTQIIMLRQPAMDLAKDLGKVTGGCVFLLGTTCHLCRVDCPDIRSV